MQEFVTCYYGLTVNKEIDKICYEVGDDRGDKVIADCFFFSSTPVTEIIASILTICLLAVIALIIWKVSTN